MPKWVNGELLTITRDYKCFHITQNLYSKLVIAA